MPLPQHVLDLKALVADRIGRRLLPVHGRETVWAGRGSGEPCALCDRTIPTTEIEYELDAPSPRATNGVVRLHLQCHALWQQLELARLSE